MSIEMPIGTIRLPNRDNFGIGELFSKVRLNKEAKAKANG